VQHGLHDRRHPRGQPIHQPVGNIVAGLGEPRTRRTEQRQQTVLECSEQMSDAVQRALHFIQVLFDAVSKTLHEVEAVDTHEP